MIADAGSDDAGGPRGFTDRGHRCLMAAEGEARSLGHDNVRSEHLLLGVLDVDERAVSGKALEAIGLPIEDVRRKMSERLVDGATVSRGPLSHSRTAKNVLALAHHSAHQLGQAAVDSYHLLLGIVNARQDPAAQVLIDLGVNPGRLRAMVIRCAASEASADGASLRDSTVMTAGTDTNLHLDGFRCAFCDGDLCEADHVLTANRIRVCGECVRTGERAIAGAAPGDRELYMPLRVSGAIPCEEAVSAIVAAIETALSRSATRQDREATIEDFDSVAGRFQSEMSRLAATRTATQLRTIRFLTDAMALVRFDVVMATGMIMAIDGPVSRNGDRWRVAARTIESVFRS